MAMENDEEGEPMPTPALPLFGTFALGAGLLLAALGAAAGAVGSEPPPLAFPRIVLLPVPYVMVCCANTRG